MKQTLFLSLSGLGLIQCQDQLDNNQILEQFITTFTDFANSLNGTATPYQAAQKIIPALINYQEYAVDIALVNQIRELNINKTLIDSVLEAISNADSRSFGLIDQQISSLFYNLDNPVCYTYFSEGIAEIYSGYAKYKKFLNNEDQQATEFQQFCTSEPNYSNFLDDLIGLVEGTGECDLLGAFYNGDPQSNFYAGWRDALADRAGYLIMYISMGVAQQTGCNSYNSSLDQDQIDFNNQYYIDALVRVIQRVIEFDIQAQQSVAFTMTQNLVQLMSDNPGLSLEVFSENFNGYALNVIYSELLVTLGVTYISSEEGDFYSECWNCINASTGDYSGIAAWLSNSSTSSLSSDLDLQQYVTESSTPQDIATAIWENVGDCISGIWIFNSSTPHSVDSAFGDRMINSKGEVYDIYVWGVQEDCLGRPAPVEQ
ncbi:UNKNOWN [Stylonychia lemnae]|uniref:Uncharacterized protein n=1 Tax=Stylonychia lemnae TaxID=5949 RepID=A0A078ARS0_STYLE|nr:UNKNOWN [Stylonychia lemnae]|eukprot:CDW84686.1 UNKNOWN [Stylonychia lemnae]